MSNAALTGLCWDFQARAAAFLREAVFQGGWGKPGWCRGFLTHFGEDWVETR